MDESQEATSLDANEKEKIAAQKNKPRRPGVSAEPAGAPDPNWVAPKSRALPPGVLRRTPRAFGFPRVRCQEDRGRDGCTSCAEQVREKRRGEERANQEDQGESGLPSHLADF